MRLSGLGGVWGKGPRGEKSAAVSSSDESITSERARARKAWPDALPEDWLLADDLTALAGDIRTLSTMFESFMSCEYHSTVLVSLKIKNSRLKIAGVGDAHAWTSGTARCKNVVLTYPYVVDATMHLHGHFLR